MNAHELRPTGGWRGARAAALATLVVGLLAASVTLAAKPATQPGPSAVRASQARAKQPIPEISAAVIGVRRISETQYRHAISDVFGPDITVSARFEPEPRLEGLLAVGASAASISASGFQQYFSAARSIAKQALSEKRRESTVGCTPADPKSPDDNCTRQFVSRYGRLLYHRPLQANETLPIVKLAHDGAAQASDFYAGLQLATAALLTSPEFLFQIDRGSPTAEGFRLDAYSRAQRMSYLFWDAPPDEVLLTAAQDSSLMTASGVKAQVDRLAASPRVADGVRAFFADLLQMDVFDTLGKDATQYPLFSQAVAASAREQTLRVLVDQLAVKSGDYRDTFTSRETLINRPLAAIYRVPFASNKEWAPFTFDEASGQSGILTEVAFLSMFAHPGRSSPTKRGAAISEIFLCQTVPQPPANVDLSAINDDKSAAKTVRERLEVHRTQPLCAGCHALTDPAGLALEQFDGIGQRRLSENGAAIDVSVRFAGQTLAGAQGLGRALRDDPRVPACLVNKLWSYSQGRPVEVSERAFLTAKAGQFAASGYKVPELMSQLASTEAFYTAPRPKPAAVASN